MENIKTPKTRQTQEEKLKALKDKLVDREKKPENIETNCKRKSIQLLQEEPRKIVKMILGVKSS